MFKKTLFALALGAVSMAASAGLSYERNTTIRDDWNGSAVIESAGALGPESGNRVAEATFTSFHPRDEHRYADGTITQEVARDGELVTVTYDGQLVLSGNPPSSTGGSPQQLTIAFVDLKVVRNEENVNLSGSLVVNGTTIDAATAPGPVRAVLLGLIRFFRI